MDSGSFCAVYGCQPVILHFVDRIKYVIMAIPAEKCGIHFTVRGGNLLRDMEGEFKEDGDFETILHNTDSERVM